VCGYFYRKENNLSLTRVGDRRQLGFMDAMVQVIQFVTQNGLPLEYLAKAYHQYMALLAFHYDRRSRLSVDAWYELQERATSWVRHSDRAALSVGFQGLTRRRTASVSALLGDALTRALSGSTEQA
jgi:hypothetical protein